MNDNHDSNSNVQASKASTPSTNSVMYLVDRDSHSERVCRRVADQLGLQFKAFSTVERFMLSNILMRPGLLVCDMAIGCESGASVHKRLLEAMVSIPVLSITSDLNQSLGPPASGPDGAKLMGKPLNPDLLARFAVDAFEADRQQVRFEQKHTVITAILGRLTDRQNSILSCVLDGMPTRAIASRHGISTRLVELERSVLLKSFGVPTTADLTMKMGEYGVLEQLRQRCDREHLIGLRPFSRSVVDGSPINDPSIAPLRSKTSPPNPNRHRGC